MRRLRNFYRCLPQDTYSCSVPFSFFGRKFRNPVRRPLRYFHSERSHSFRFIFVSGKIRISDTFLPSIRYKTKLGSARVLLSRSDCDRRASYFGRRVYCEEFFGYDQNKVGSFIYFGGRLDFWRGSHSCCGMVLSEKTGSRRKNPGGFSGCYPHRNFSVCRFDSGSFQIRRDDRYRPFFGKRYQE